MRIQNVLEEHVHVWLGCNVSRDMLNREVAASHDNNVGSDDKDYEFDDDNDHDADDDSTMWDKNNGTRRRRDLLHHHMGTSLPFRPATFDDCISISALQWLSYSNKRDEFPKKRLMRFFSVLFVVLRRGARAVLQLFPNECAAKAVGFVGGFVVDYPSSTNAKKHYLVFSFERLYRAPPGLVGCVEVGRRWDGTDDEEWRSSRGRRRTQECGGKLAAIAHHWEVAKIIRWNASREEHCLAYQCGTILDSHVPPPPPDLRYKQRIHPRRGGHRPHLPMRV
ncbi:hypothetical protein ACHAXA_007272 [Cyclostephanos tholiformis]|uniref:Uncharacterized protein n=1 Tax=Cyclostephanos tholiformis TaxID=382380 RepID=A0ABD3SGK1_9STRA